ncbi:MAG TPA: aldose 1-epimerase family protein [Blastocatellia bacterium]|nr:aldose 1-epimerase family protein [Blastocatellia bacterium]
MLRLICLVMFSATFVGASPDDPFRQILTSVSRNIHLDTWQVTHRDFDFKSAAPWSVQKYTLRGGKQEGVDVIVVNNGRLSFIVIPTRGMSVARVEMGDIRLGWDSPVKEIVHPQFINLQSRGGLGWLEGFNEWMVRCGLEWAGHPGKDKFINNTGDEAEMDLTLHGKVGNIPASEVEVVIDRSAPHRIRVRGRVDERMFYGPKLELWSEISTEPGSNAFRVEDEVKNYGAYDQEFQIIYHSNYGPPLLEAGSRFVAAAKEVRPFNAHAAKSLNQFAEYVAPTKGFIEQVYGVIPYADENNRATVMLRNAAGDKGVSLSYMVDQLPYFTLWKNTTAIEEGYVTGLEPGTGFPANRSIERQAGRVPKLKPNESRKFAINFEILAGNEQVNRTAALIQGYQGPLPTRLNPQPIRPEDKD